MGRSQAQQAQTERGAVGPHVPQPRLRHVLHQMNDDLTLIQGHAELLALTASVNEDQLMIRQAKAIQTAVESLADAVRQLRGLLHRPDNSIIG